MELETSLPGGFAGPYFAGYNGGGAMMMIKGITGFAAFIAGVGLLVGLALSGSEILNPRRAEAEALRLNTETAAQVARNTYEQQRLQIELERLRALAEIDRQKAIARSAKELEWITREQQLKARLFEAFVEILPLGLVAVLLVLAFGIAVYLGCRGIALLQPQQWPGPVAKPEKGAVIPFPAQSTLSQGTA